MENQKPTCFVIMPISDVPGYEPGHFARVYEHFLKPAILHAGYIPIRADDTVKTDYIVIGIIQKIVECEMVICDFSARNANVMYELGIRHAFNKPVVLTKDRKTEKIFDIQGLRYTEYDDSLRIDTVQKDIIRLSSAITETANIGPNGVNSVVQLAGVRAAELPAGQMVSADTKLLLSAIASLERHVDISEPSKYRATKYFKFEDDKVIFSDSSSASIGDTIYDSKADLVGVVVDIHPIEEKVFIRQNDGQTISLSASSTRSKGLTEIPF